MSKEIHFSESRFEYSMILSWAEGRMAGLLSLLGIFWLLLITLNAGPLWRDELCSVMLAEEKTVQDFWHNLGTDSSPLLWPTLLRIWISLGMTTDLQIRVLGFLIGACLLTALWLTSRWVGRGVPILSTSLLIFSPAFLFAISSVRAYGVGSVMLVCTIGLTWRAVEQGSTARLLWLMGASMLTAHSLYTAAPFIFVILSAGIFVSAWHRKWKTAMWVLAIGLLTAVSMVIYRPIILNAGTGIGLFQIPIGVPWIIMSMRRAVETAGPAHTLAWVLLVLLGLSSWLCSSIRRPFPHMSMSESKVGVSLFCVIIMLGAFLFFGLTLLRMKVPTQFWYYAPLMAVVAVTIDGVMGGRQHSPFFRTCRLILAFILPLSAVSGVWQETQTRRTTMDIAARELMLKAGPQDLIIIDPFYLVTSFERYYGGKTRWMTVPPLGDTRSGGYGSVQKAMMEKDPLEGLFSSIEETFRSGNRVWIVGGVFLIDPQKLPPPPPAPPDGPLGWNHAPYSQYWTLRLGAFLVTHADYMSRISTDPGRPVNPFEDVPLLMFSSRERPED